MDCNLWEVETESPYTM